MRRIKLSYQITIIFVVAFLLTSLLLGVLIVRRLDSTYEDSVFDRLEDFGNDGAAIREFGLEVVTKLCERLLLGGAPGLHIYTLNRANATMRLWQRLHHL